MAHFVKIACVQFATQASRGAADAPKLVLNELKAALEELKGYGVQLAVFCEGVEAYGTPVDLAEDAAKPGPFLQAYAAFAQDQNCHVAGSVKLREGGRAYNSIAFLGPDGRVLGAYHKTNLTHREIEWGLTSGPGAKIVETAVGKLGGIVCFDLNFEPLRKEYKALRPDILCFASMYHGGLVQGMWAYDCRSFFASALPFMGCGVLDPFGREQAATDCYSKVAMATVNLDREIIHLDYNREKFAEIRRKYLGEAVIDIPPNVGSALLYSLTHKRRAMDIVREFELELLDDYFERALADNAKNKG
ncbi:MAG: carbon-nitrogen hydrolase family protein [Planctomycetota bacterium]|nr:carbon-nitrogen hydrolase family protein [Planctomycetota bacterium]